MRKKARKQKIQETRQIQNPKQERNIESLKEDHCFKPCYCQQLVEHCSRGYSFQSFAAYINLLPETLEEWTEKYPEFKKARAIAALKQKVFWEKAAVDACMEKFSFSIFRYFAGNKDENPSAHNSVVILPKEENPKNGEPE